MQLTVQRRQGCPREGLQVRYGLVRGDHPRGQPASTLGKMELINVGDEKDGHFPSGRSCSPKEGAQARVLDSIDQGEAQQELGQV